MHDSIGIQTMPPNPKGSFERSAPGVNSTTRG